MLESLPEVSPYIEGFFDLTTDYVCFGWDWIKWYENYRDVSLVEEVLAQAETAGIPWQFFRSGEEYDDIENRNSENFYDSELPVLNVTIEITY